MRTLEIKTKYDRIDLLRASPQESDCRNLITESFKMIVDGKVRAVYLTDQPLSLLYSAVSKLDKKSFGISRRLAGIAGGFSRTFGYAPRDPLRQHDYCTRTALYRQKPDVAKVLTEHAEHLSSIYRSVFPESHESQTNLIKNTVRPEWVMPGGIFTSGIVNWNNPLQYHYDAGNFEDTWSVMCVFKKKTDGGHLIIPDFDVKVELAHSSIFLFDGQQDLHGVTPIIKREEDSHRYSVVYYALSRMCKCKSPTEELKHAQKSRTETEMKRAGLKK